MAVLTSCSSLYTEHFSTENDSNGIIPKLVVVGDSISGKKTLVERLLAFPVPRAVVPILFHIRKNLTLNQDVASIHVEDSGGSILCDTKSIESKETANSLYLEVLGDLDDTCTHEADRIEATVVVTLSGPNYPNLDISILPYLNKSIRDRDQILVRQSLDRLFAESVQRKNIYFLMLVPMNTRLSSAAVMDVYIEAQKPLLSTHIFPGLVVFTKFNQCIYLEDPAWCSAFMTSGLTSQLVFFKSPRFVCLNIEADRDGPESSPIWSVRTTHLDSYEQSVFTSCPEFSTDLIEHNRATCSALIGHIAAFCNDFQRREYMPVYIFRLLASMDKERNKPSQLRGCTKLGVESISERELRRALEYVAQGFPAISIKPPSKSSGSTVRTAALNKLMREIVDATESDSSMLQALWEVALHTCRITSSAGEVEDMIAWSDENFIFSVHVNRRCRERDFLLSPTSGRDQLSSTYGAEINDAGRLPWHIEATAKKVRCQLEEVLATATSGRFFSFLVPGEGPLSETAGDEDRHATISISLLGIHVKSFKIPIRERPSPEPEPPTVVVQSSVASSHVTRCNSDRQVRRTKFGIPTGGKLCTENKSADTATNPPASTRTSSTEPSDDVQTYHARVVVANEGTAAASSSLIGSVDSSTRATPVLAPVSNVVVEPSPEQWGCESSVKEDAHTEPTVNQTDVISIHDKPAEAPACGGGSETDRIPPTEGNLSGDPSQPDGVKLFINFPPLLYYDDKSQKDTMVECFHEDVICVEHKQYCRVPKIVLTGEHNCGKRNLLAKLVGFPVPCSEYEVPVSFHIRRQPQRPPQSAPSPAAKIVVLDPKHQPLHDETPILTKEAATDVYDKVLQNIEQLCQNDVDMTIVITLTGPNYPNLDVMYYPSIVRQSKKLVNHIRRHRNYSMYLFVIKAANRLHASSCLTDILQGHSHSLFSYLVIFTDCNEYPNPGSFRAKIRSSLESVDVSEKSVCINPHDSKGNGLSPEMNDWEAEMEFFGNLYHMNFLDRDRTAGCSRVLFLLEQFYCKKTLQKVYPAIMCRLLLENDLLRMSGRSTSAAARFLLQTVQATVHGMQLHHHFLSYRNYKFEAVTDDNQTWDDTYSTLWETIREFHTIALYRIDPPNVCCWSLLMVSPMKARFEGLGIRAPKWQSVNIFNVIIPQRCAIVDVGKWADETNFLPIKVVIKLDAKDAEVSVERKSVILESDQDGLQTWNYTFHYTLPKAPKLPTADNRPTVCIFDVFFLDDYRIYGITLAPEEKESTMNRLKRITRWRL